MLYAAEGCESWETHRWYSEAPSAAGVGNAVLGANLEVSHHLDALEPGGGDLLEVGVLLIGGSGFDGERVVKLCVLPKISGPSRAGTAGRAARDPVRSNRIARAISQKGHISDLPLAFRAPNLKTAARGGSKAFGEPRPGNAPGRRGPSRCQWENQARRCCCRGGRPQRASRRRRGPRRPSWRGRSRRPAAWRPWAGARARRRTRCHPRGWG